MASVSAGPGDSVTDTLNLVAGGGNPASVVMIGTVTVWEDGGILYLQYAIDTGTYPSWVLTEVHSDAETSVTAIPQINGNPVPGKFFFAFLFRSPAVS